jgi:hypothetical protein
MKHAKNNLATGRQDLSAIQLSGSVHSRKYGKFYYTNLKSRRE